MAFEVERYDLLVLGSGEAGKYLAWTMAKTGLRCAVVERKLIGGSCPNTNCLPSKNEIWSAKVADLVHHADQFGSAQASTPVDMKKVVARKRAMVDGLIALHLDNYKTSGAELIMGTGRFTAPKTIEVALNAGGTRVLTAPRVVLNLGTRATIPDIPGLAAAAPLSNVELLDLDRLPGHLIVLGGGYVGLELAQTYRRFGSRVTIVETGPQLAAREDDDVAGELLDRMREEGMEVHLGARISRVEGRSGGSVRLFLQVAGSDCILEGSDILVAVGRTPNTEGIGLDDAGIILDTHGYIAVDDRLATSAPDVWAVGECAGSRQFTHVSLDDFRVVHANWTGGERTTRGRLIPYCMFTDPPLAHVGLHEKEARQQGIAIRLAKLPMSAVLRARTLSETHGFMKALVAADSERILGFTMIGPEAGEVVAVVQTAMLAGMPYTGLRDAIIAHPTMAEGLGALFVKVS
jgi:pyruvate/2-oxoglutarate dehydrogenase complex dihydrolipoamide dehydrogenase (E3) component